MSDKRWTPIRNGIYYCSPACGGGRYCKITWFDRAGIRAAALVERLGFEWKSRVFENLGWHFSVSRGGASISESTYDNGKTYRYSCIFGGQYVGKGSTPEDAFNQALALARDVARKANQLIEGVEPMGAK